MAPSKTVIYFLSVIQIHLSIAINCGDLNILCNTGDPSCYQGPCANMAPYFANINEAPPIPSSRPIPSPPTPLPTNPIIIPSPSDTIIKPNPNPSQATSQPRSCPGNQQINSQGFCQCLPQAPDGGWFPLCNPPLLKDPIWCDCIPLYITLQQTTPTPTPAPIPTPQPTPYPITPQPIATPVPTKRATPEPTIPDPEPEPVNEDNEGSSSSSSDEEEQVNLDTESLGSDTTTSSTSTEGPLTCPLPGHACTDELPRAERCCDGQIGGRNKCKYNAVDMNGFRTGYCCVKRQRDGCLRDADCCNAKDSCINGWCKVSSTAKSIVNGEMIDIEAPLTDTHIVDVYNEKDDDHKKSERLHEIFFTTGAAFFILSVFILPIMYYWYSKIYWLSKFKHVRTRPRSTAIWENDPSDFTDRESDWIPSDDSDLP